MNNVNPYNCTKPGNLFMGYERLRQELLTGFLNGNSYAVLGGRRIGKTSFLMQLEKDIYANDLLPFHPLPCRFSIQELRNITPATLFEKIYNLTVSEVKAETWIDGKPAEEYQIFLKHLDNAAPILKEKYGPDWVVILLIDELDAAISKLPDDQFFQNLRNLLMESRFHRHFRVVATGLKDMARLIFSGGSPLNNLRHKYMGILDTSQAHELVKFGFKKEYDDKTMSFLVQLSGKHPFLLQGILEKLWRDQTKWDEKAIKRAGRELLKEHNEFQRWMDDFGSAEQFVYRCIADTPAGKIHVSEIIKQIEASLRSQIDQALTILSYHGVIDDSDPDEPEIAGTLFRDWFVARLPDNGDGLFKKLSSEQLSDYIDSAILAGMEDQYESHKESLDNKDYARANKIASGIYEMCNTIASSLDRERDREIYLKVIALSSYWRLCRDLYHERII